MAVVMAVQMASMLVAYLAVQRVALMVVCLVA